MAETLSSELIGHVRQVWNNQHYRLKTRVECLEQVRAEIDALLIQHEYETSMPEFSQVAEENV